MKVVLGLGKICLVEDIKYDRGIVELFFKSIGWWYCLFGKFRKFYILLFIWKVLRFDFLCRIVFIIFLVNVWFDGSIIKKDKL